MVRADKELALFHKHRAGTPSFGNNDELLCNWCGMQFKAIVDEDGTLKLKEL